MGRKLNNFLKGLDKVVRPVADFFGLDSSWDRIMESSMKRSIVTSADINTMLDQLVNDARSKGLANLNELQAKLDSLNLSKGKSNLVTRAVSEAVDNTKKAVNKGQAAFDAAEQLMTNARNTASQVDFASGTDRMHGFKSLPTTADRSSQNAKKMAETAKNLYNNINVIDKEVN